MRTIFLFICVVLLTTVLVPSAASAQSRPLSIVGAWTSTMGDNERTMICSDKYYAIAIYNVKDKRFVGTYGGSYRLENDGYVVTMEFHSLNPETVGNEYSGNINVKNNVLSVDEDGGISEWKKVDDGKPGKLAGAWVITGRMRDGKLSKMTPGARRTMKILSGTRFQWIAYNVETHEFSGTGGGTYTTRDGKYTENIEFFSRDSSRVGASLTFDFSIEGGNW